MNRFILLGIVFASGQALALDYPEPSSEMRQQALEQMQQAYPPANGLTRGEVLEIGGQPGLRVATLPLDKYNVYMVSRDADGVLRASCSNSDDHDHAGHQPPSKER